jgi:glycosyltransferase involved in cell wall biosynthesis
VVFQLRSLSGGIGIVVARLATEFERLGVDVGILCEKPPGSSVSVLPSTIDVECTGSTMKARGFLRLLAYLRRRRPDHVITNDRRANVAAISAKRILLSRTAITSVVHDTYSIAMRSKSEDDQRTQIRQYRRFYPYNDRIISVSRGAGEDFAALANIAADRIDVIYNPLPLRNELETSAASSGHRWLTMEETVPVIVGAGRLQREQKNFALLLRAFSLLLKQRKARLIIIGEGKDRA